MGIMDRLRGQRPRLKPGRPPGFKMTEEHKQAIGEGQKRRWARQRDAKAFM